jgi:hypothetical protein
MNTNMNFSPEAIQAIQKFGAAIEQPQSVNSSSFNHDQAFIAWLGNRSEFECSGITEFICSEGPTAKIARTPFAVRTNEGEKVEYINSASPNKLQMNGTAVITVPEYGKPVSVRMSVATFAAVYGMEKFSLKANIGSITIGQKAQRGEKWLSLSSSETPNFTKLSLALAPKVGEPAANSNNRNQRNQNNKNQ